MAKRLVANRHSRGKGLSTMSPLPRQPASMSTAALVRAFQEDADQKRSLIRRAQAARNRLLFIAHAMRQLLDEAGFHDLLVAEGLNTMPKNLAARIHRSEVA